MDQHSYSRTEALETASLRTIFAEILLRMKQVFSASPEDKYLKSLVECVKDRTQSQKLLVTPKELSTRLKELRTTSHFSMRRDALHAKANTLLMEGDRVGCFCTIVHYMEKLTGQRMIDSDPDGYRSVVLDDIPMATGNASLLGRLMMVDPAEFTSSAFIYGANLGALLYYIFDESEAPDNRGDINDVRLRSKFREVLVTADQAAQAGVQAINRRLDQETDWDKHIIIKSGCLVGISRGFASVDQNILHAYFMKHSKQLMDTVSNELTISVDNVDDVIRNQNKEDEKYQQLVEDEINANPEEFEGVIDISGGGHMGSSEPDSSGPVVPRDQP